MLMNVDNKFCYVGLAFSRQMSTNVLVSELCVKGKRVLISIHVLSSLYHIVVSCQNMYFF